MKGLQERIEADQRTRIGLGFGLILALAGCSAAANQLAVSPSALTTGDAGTTDIVQVETILLPSDVSRTAKFGSSLAISGDVLVTAAPSWNIDGSQSLGGVYVFVRDPGTGQWLEQKRIVPRKSSLEWSFTVAIDGDTLAIGVPYTSVGPGFQRGAVYIYERNQGGTDNWGEVIKLSGSNLGDLAQFGSSLALAGDLLVVGAPEPSSIGQVVFFERNRGGANAWGETSRLSYNDDAGLSPEYFGISLALDGDLLLVGATSADVSYYASNDGAAYLFQRDTVDRDRWTYVTRLTEPEATLCTEGRTISEMWTQPQEVQDAWTLCAQGNTSTDNAGFGGNVALGGDTALVTGRGIVNVFVRDVSDASLWPRVSTLENTDGTGFARLALEGDTLLVGASGTDVDSKVDQGAVYVFQRDPSTRAFVEVQTLIAADGLSDDHFGNSLALQGSTRVVGAYARAGYRGALYVQETDAPPPQLPPGCQPLTPPTDILEDAATITHSSGFTLEAPEGALETPMPVWIQLVVAPAAPLPPDAVALGDYYSVGAECTRFTPPGKQFLLGLPVPDSLDTAHLGAALLVPASSVQDGPASGAFWQPLNGTYDAERRLFIVAVAALVDDGNTLVLIEHPNLDSGRSAGVAAAPSARERGIFDVQCGMTIDRSICTDRAKSEVNFALREAYRVFQQQGFPEPYMKDSLGTVGTRPYHVQIREESDNDWDLCYGKVTGAYEFQTGTIAFCVPPAGPIPPLASLLSTARHELFHAIQYAYPNVREGARDEWVLEGTADTAVRWDGAMHRKPSRAFRRADIPLTEGNPPELLEHAYRAQDFWVHLFVATGSDGVRRNHPLGLLDSFFFAGASTASVAARLSGGISSPTFDDLGSEYWAWAKNQVIEKTDVTFDGKLGNPCMLENALVGEPLRVVYTGPGPDDPQPFRADGRIEHGLETQVMEITFPEQVDDVTIIAEGGGNDLAYKVYLFGESECVGPDAPDGARTFDEPLPAGAVVWVVLANKNPGADPPPLAYEVQVNVAPH